MIYRNADGSSNTYDDPVTGDKFECCYEEGDTWNEKFG
jgi:hypothetical protein